MNSGNSGGFAIGDSNAVMNSPPPVLSEGSNPNAVAVSIVAWSLSAFCCLRSFTCKSCTRSSAAINACVSSTGLVSSKKGLAIGSGIKPHGHALIFSIHTSKSRGDVIISLNILDMV